MSNMESPNYYAIIPANVRYDKDLKANEKLLYGEITALAQASGKCFASNEYFAELYGTTRETVSRWISNLKKCGYVDVIITYKEDGKTIDKRIITLLTKKSIPSCEKNQYPIDKKIKENNTRINNTSIKEERMNKKENSSLDLQEIASDLETEYFDNAIEMKYPLHEKKYLDFIQFRKELKKPITKTAAKEHIQLLCKYPQDIQEEMIKQSISSNWQGLFVLKIANKQQSNFTQPKSKVQKTNEFIDDFFERMAEQGKESAIDVEVLS